MANIIEYIQLRGDITLKHDNINEVDKIIKK